jgi:hypothetical protein
MKSRQKVITFFCILVACYTNAQIVPFNSERWTIEAKGHVIDGYEGETNVLFLQRGSAILNDVDFENGIIEFDIFLSVRRGFPGVIFRMTDDNNYEEFYLRAHLSGMPDAMQYAPVFGGNSSWQLYHDQANLVQNGRVSFEMRDHNGYNTTYAYPYDRWLHVKLAVSDTRAEVYFDHQEKPTLQISQLRHGATHGGIGVSTNVSPFYFANFSYTAMPHVDLLPLPETSFPSEQFSIPSWDISQVMPESSLKNTVHLESYMLDTMSWQKARSEPSGITNISAVRALRSEINTVLARAQITSRGDQIKKFDFGYSDRVRVYCNGVLLYSGNNTYLTRDYRFLGTIGYFDSVYLPLKNGENEIILAVSETFGGWGVQGKFENMERISLK